MAVPARRIEFELEKHMEQRTVLEERVEHIQQDVAEIKADIRRVESRVDGRLGKCESKLDALGESLAEHRLETERSFAAVRIDLGEQIGLLRTSMETLHRKIVTWLISTAIALGALMVGVATFIWGVVR